MDMLTEKYDETERDQKGNNALIYGFDIRTTAEAIGQSESNKSAVQHTHSYLFK